MKAMSTPDTGDMMKKIMLIQGYYFSISVYITLIVYEK
jgi:hypothetical protein